MRHKFDHWLSSTLSAPAQLSPDADARILDQLHGAMRSRTIRRRTASRRAIVTCAVTTGLAILLLRPIPLGGNSSEIVFERYADSGAPVYRDPLTLDGYVARDEAELELQMKIRDNAALGRARFVGAEFLRFHGEHWSLLYDHVLEDGTEITSTTNPQDPPRTIPIEKARILLPRLDHVQNQVDAGKAWPLPPERHVVDGRPYLFQVWRVDDPVVGEVIVGRGQPL